eukprot:9248672-Karenia_brevis.AAC.1
MVLAGAQAGSSAFTLAKASLFVTPFEIGWCPAAYFAMSQRGWTSVTELQVLAASNDIFILPKNCILIQLFLLNILALPMPKLLHLKTIGASWF